jgi:hypothetical protein
MPWTRITDPDHAAELLPTWFSGRMIGERGAFGLLLTTGDVMRITSIMALATSDGLTFVDVLLDNARSTSLALQYRERRSPQSTSPT